jgi:hypothetical protein
MGDAADDLAKAKAKKIADVYEQAGRNSEEVPPPVDPEKLRKELEAAVKSRGKGASTDLKAPPTAMVGPRG